MVQGQRVERLRGFHISSHFYPTNLLGQERVSSVAPIPLNFSDRFSPTAPAGLLDCQEQAGPRFLEEPLWTQVEQPFSFLIEFAVLQFAVHVRPVDSASPALKLLVLCEREKIDRESLP